jgi:hypothetical protein
MTRKLEPHDDTKPAPRRQDPMLEDLWAFKAQLNKESGYDVHRLYERIQREAAEFFDREGRVIVPARLLSQRNLISKL